MMTEEKEEMRHVVSEAVVCFSFLFTFGLLLTVLCMVSH